MRADQPVASKVVRHFFFFFPESLLHYNRRMHYLDSTFLASCSLSLVWHAIASAEAWHAVLIKIYSIILRILLGHKSPSTAVSVKHQSNSEKRERERESCKCITCEHTQPLLSLFFPTHDHTIPLSVCFSLSTLIIHVLLSCWSPEKSHHMQGYVVQTWCVAVSLSWQRSLPFHNTDLDLAAVWRAVEDALWLRWERREEWVVG